MNKVGTALNNAFSGRPQRRTLACYNSLGTAQLHFRNPYIVALWSALFPGFGHILLSQYPKGLILFIWEIFINLKAHVNLALMYTVLGQYDQARGAVDLRWSLLYIPVYIFAVWDSYRVAVDLNKHYILASREDARVDAFFMNAYSVTFLDKRSPYVAASWCALVPGLSHLMLHRLLHAVFMVFWWIVVVTQSNVLTAVHLTCFGAFTSAAAATNPQWLLNIPSLLFFCIYAAYVNAMESNRLFDREQSQFLRNNFQSPKFPFPDSSPIGEGAAMFVISVFKQTLNVELAVTALSEEGISPKDIMAVPIEKEMPQKKLFDSMYASTGGSLFDLALILGALAMLAGSIYGYILRWGPVIWGAIGAVAGFCIGFLVKLLIIIKKKTAAHENEVVILVACARSETEHIKQLLRDNGALGVSSCGAAP